MPTPTKTAERATPPQIIWADPPAPRASARKIESAVVDALRARPGHWARVKSYDKKTSAWGAAKGINKGSIGSGFEARGVATKTGSELYVRFVGK